MFTIHKTDTGAVVPWEYMPAVAGEYKAGQMVEVKNGFIQRIGAASHNVPEYLCMANITVEENGELVPATRVSTDVIYETVLDYEAEKAAVGSGFSVLAGGEVIGKYNDEGPFELTYVDEAVAGGMARGRFIRLGKEEI